MREAYIVASVRTPGGRAKRGGLKDTRADVLASTAIKAALAKVPSLDPKNIDDLVFGCSFPEAEQGLNIGRVIAKHAGLPDDVPGYVINRFCSSGLQAVALAAQNIMCGWNDIVIAGGVEAMSRVPMGGYINRPDPEWTDTYPDVYMSMGSTAENVAKRYNISREDQDKMGVESNRRAYEAQQNGWFKEELAPVTEAVRYKIKDGKRIKEHYTFDADDGVRWPTTIEGLGKLKSPFWKDGSVTAGNASQTTDGAACSILMSKEKCDELGIKPLAKVINFQVAGCRADEMGVGPRYAIPRVLKKAGLDINQIDYFEINEAFASQAIYSCRELGILERYWNGDINGVGGAIALGHPLGCTGAKLTATLIHQMRRLGKKRGIISMCIGGGMGAAGIIELVE